MLNIVIPMAGAGSRFAKAGFELPKPLISVNGVPMIRLVIENLRPKLDHRFIFLCQRAHIAQYELLDKLEAWAPGCTIVAVDGLTEGAAATVLLAKELINNDEPLMIANSDQFVDIDIADYLSKLRGHDGLIMTMPAADPKWSYVAKDTRGFVTRVVEKEVISKEATVGIYNFAKGRHFVSAAEAMMMRDERVNGEFYVAPTYNQMITQGAHIVTQDIGDAMYGIGIPTDLNAFLQTTQCERATKGLV